MDNPDGELIFGLAPNYAEFEMVYINDEVEFFNQARFLYDLGESNNFKVSALYLNQPTEATGVGVLYSPEHWNIDWLYGIDVSAWIMESGNYTVALDGKYDIADGYGLKMNLLAGLDSGFSKDYIDGRVAMWHNLYPDGSMTIEVGYEDRADTGYVYFAVGGSI